MTPRWLLALALLLAGLSPRSATAHAIGLSRGHYRPLPDGLEVELVFARGELSRPGASQRIVHAVRVTDGAGLPCQGQLLRTDANDPSSTHLLARYRCQEPAALHVALEFWDELEPGHRQLVSRGGDTPPESSWESGELYQRERASFDLAGVAPGASPGLAGWVQLGIEHILAGYDHLAFLLALLLVARTLRSLAASVSVFTLAHSLTLGLATLGVLAPPSWAVECAIALSICYVGVENLTARAAHPRRALLFGFGLMHGFGFAGALHELGANGARAPFALFGFNLGVELGQLAVLLALFPLLLWLRRSSWFAARAVPVLSAAIAVAGALWFAGRLPLTPASSALDTAAPPVGRG